MARSAIHPGEHLAEAMETLGVSAAQLARDIHVPTNRVTSILNRTRAVTADTALRLGRYFDTSPEFWMNLQQLYELRRAAEQIGSGIEDIPRGKPRATKADHPSPV
jgi:addiction module HigA family antidote